MPEIIWKQGAENDLLQIFADLEDYSEGAGERLVRKLDLTLENLKIHPEIAPIFESPVRRLVIGIQWLWLVLFRRNPRDYRPCALHSPGKRIPETIREKMDGFSDSID